MNSKVGSLEEKVKLPAAETISRFYQPQANRKVIRILTVAVYVFCVSLAAIMLSLYYIFIWDPTLRPFATKFNNNCDKIVIPEQIAIRLINSSELSAEQFYKYIFEEYKHIYRQQQLQEQRHLHQHYQHHHNNNNGLSTAAKMQQDIATIMQKTNQLNVKNHVTSHKNNNKNNNTESIYRLVPPPSQMPIIELKPSLESVAVPHNKPSHNHNHHNSHRKNINSNNKKHHKKNTTPDTTDYNDHNNRMAPMPLLLRDHSSPANIIAASAVAFPSGKPLSSPSTGGGHRTPTAPPINEKPMHIDDEDYSDDDNDDDLDYDSELAQEGESSGFFPNNYEYVSNRKRLNLD